MMKGAFPVLGVIIIGLLATAAIVYYTGGGLIGRAEIITIDGQSCGLIRPLFGRYSCEAIEPVKDRTVASWTGDQKDGQVYVICDANTPSCDIKVKCNYGGSLTGGTYFYYQADGNSNCLVGSGKWCSTGVSPNALSAPIMTLQKGQRMRVASCAASLPGAWPGEIYESYTPYALVKYDKGAAKSIYNAQMCTIANTGSVMKDCGNEKGGGVIACTETSGSTALGRVLKVDGQLVFGDWVNYLDFYVDVPHISNIKSYQGQNVLCESYGNKVWLYSLGKITTVSSCYFVEKDKVAEVECCEGERYQDYVCQDWKWVKVTPETPTGCVSSLECSNRGQVYMVGTGKWQETCTNGKCIAKSLGTVECAKSADCQSGYICNLETYKCERSIPNIVCGDGICSAPYEDANTCVSDCKNTFLEQAFDFISYFVIGLIISAVLVGALVLLTPLKLLLRRGWKFMLLAVLGLTLLIALGLMVVL